MYDASFVTVNPQHNEQLATAVNISKEAATPAKMKDTEVKAVRLDNGELPLPPPASITSGIVMDTKSTCTKSPDNTSVSGTGDGELSYTSHSWTSLLFLTSFSLNWTTAKDYPLSISAASFHENVPYMYMNKGFEQDYVVIDCFIYSEKQIK